MLRLTPHSAARSPQQSAQQPAKAQGLARIAALCVVLLSVFALYAPALRLMPLHDDAVLMPAINNRNLITIFENRPYGDGHHRPVSYLPWLLARDLFGWFTPAILHMWNVAVHVANTALVAALAWRLSGLLWKRRSCVSVFAALIFGFAPLSYEAVLWASALVHPLPALFGLASVHSYLTARQRPPSRSRMGFLALSIALLLAACLSHEIGFVFGLMAGLIEVAFLLKGQRPWRAVVLPLALALVYPVYYRAFLITKWTTDTSQAGLVNAQEFLSNVAYQAQALLAWPALLIQKAIGPFEQQTAILLLLLLLVVSLILAAIVLWRRRAGRFGLIALLCWIVLILPSSATLGAGYVLISPRMTYIPAAGAALIWAVVLAVAWDAAKRLAARLILIGLCTLMLLWGAAYVVSWLDETARLTPALRIVDDDLRQSKPSDRLLFINAPFLSQRVHPWFPLGREAMPIWTYPYTNRSTPMWAWPASVNGIVRETVNDRHDISLTNRETNYASPDATFTRGNPFIYGVSGEYTDDGKLRNDLLASNLIYRFDFDETGLRGRRLAHISQGKPDGDALAILDDGQSQVQISSVSANRCGSRIELKLTWWTPEGVRAPAAIFVHGLDASGQQILVADGDLIEGYLPLDLLKPDMAIAETRYVRLPANDVLVEQITLGVYNRDNLSRFRSVRADGSPWEGDQVTLPVARDSARCEPQW